MALECQALRCLIVSTCSVEQSSHPTYHAEYGQANRISNVVAVGYVAAARMAGQGIPAGAPRLRPSGGD